MYGQNGSLALQALGTKRMKYADAEVILSLTLRRASDRTSEALLIFNQSL